MNKTGLISAVAERTGMTKKDADAAVCAVFDIITDALREEEKVQIVGFGTFETRCRGERIGRDPRTNEMIMIAPSKSPAFKPGKTFKDSLNNK